MKHRNVMTAIRVALLATAILTLCRGFFASVVVGPKTAKAPKPGVFIVTSADEVKIRELLTEQAGAWNRGDIDSFMTSYWKSDETLFVGATGVARGWLGGGKLCSSDIIGPTPIERRWDA